MANATIYLPYDNIDLGAVFAGAVATRDASNRPTAFDVILGGQPARFNVMPSAAVGQHLAGFAGWIDSLDESADRKADAKMLVGGAKYVLGLVAAGEFAENPALWQCLFQVADKWDGFVFVYDSLLLPNGGVIVGPLGAG